MLPKSSPKHFSQKMQKDSPQKFKMLKGEVTAAVTNWCGHKINLWGKKFNFILKQFYFFVKYKQWLVPLLHFLHEKKTCCKEVLKDSFQVVVVVVVCSIFERSFLELFEAEYTYFFCEVFHTMSFCSWRQPFNRLRNKPIQIIFLPTQLPCTVFWKCSHPVLVKNKFNISTCSGRSSFSLKSIPDFNIVNFIQSRPFLYLFCF